MELVLQRPFSLPAWTQITSYLRGLFFAEGDEEEDQSIVTELNEDHDKEDDEKDPNIIAGGSPDKDKGDGKKDGEGADEDEDDEDKDAEIAKLKKSKAFFQASHQRLGKALKDRDPDLYESLSADADEEEEEEGEKVDLEDRHLDEIKGEELISMIVNKVDARAEKREKKRKSDRANRQVKKEFVIAQEEILRVQKEEGFSNEQRTEAVDWAKGLGVTDPLRLAQAVIHYMSKMAPAAPKTPEERVEASKKAREIALAQQPKKKAADRGKPKTGDAKILDEMRSLKPRSVLSLLDRDRK